METGKTDNSNRRRFHRVPAPRSATLLNLAGVSFEGMVVDLSLCGMFLHGEYDAQVGDMIELLLYGHGQHLSLLFKYGGKVVRVTQNGVALEFVGMEPRSYDYLQTVILYFSENPLGACLEFPEVFTAHPARGMYIK